MRFPHSLLVYIGNGRTGFRIKHYSGSGLSVSVWAEAGIRTQWDEVEFGKPKQYGS